MLCILTVFICPNDGLFIARCKAHIPAEMCVIDRNDTKDIFLDKALIYPTIVQVDVLI